MSGDLAAWLREQVDEDERGARSATNRMPSTWNPPSQERLDLDRGDYALSAGRGYEMEVFGQVWDVRDGSVATHIARYDPAWVLAEVAAKRRVIALHSPTPGFGCLSCSVCADGPGGFGDTMWQAFPCETLLALASVYAGRPGWREEWAADEEVQRG